MNRRIQLIPQGKYLFQAVLIHFRDAAADLNVYARLPEQPDPPDRFFKAGRVMTESAVFFLIRSVKRDVHSARFIPSEKIRPFFIDQCAVGIDRNDKSHAAQFQIQPFKIREQQRFSAGEQQKQNTRLFHLLPDRDPFIRRMQAAERLNFFPAQADITHVTVHVADGEQFQAAVDGHFFCLALVIKTRSTVDPFTSKHAIYISP